MTLVSVQNEDETTKHTIDDIELVSHPILVEDDYLLSSSLATTPPRDHFTKPTE